MNSFTTLMVVVVLGLLLIVSKNPVTSAAATSSFRGKVDFGGLPSTNLIVRCDALQQAFVRSDGTFVLRDVPPGLHEITVVDALRSFSKATVELDSNGKLGRIIESVPAQQPNQAPIRREIKTLLLKPLGLIDYFEKRQQMSASSLFANPMMLMMFFTLGLGVLMPKLMENMDPEELKQMQEQMAQQQKVTADPSKAVASLFGKTQEQQDSDEE